MGRKRYNQICIAKNHFGVDMTAAVKQVVMRYLFFKSQQSHQHIAYGFHQDVYTFHVWWR